MKKIIFVVLILLFIGGWMIKGAYETDFDDSSDRKTFFKVFSQWLKQLGTNMIAITSYTVKQDWTPELNETDD